MYNKTNEINNNHFSKPVMRKIKIITIFEK